MHNKIENKGVTCDKRLKRKINKNYKFNRKIYNF